MALGDTSRDGADHIYSNSDIEGVLEYDNHTLNVTFNAHCLYDGSIDFEFAPIQFNNDAHFLDDAFNSCGPQSPNVSLTGHAPDGTIIRAPSIYLTQHGINSDMQSATVALRATCHDLTVDIPAVEGDTIPEFQTEYIVSGLRCYRSAPIDGPLGQVSILGELKPDDYSRLNGLIVIDSAQPNLEPPDTEKIDAHIERILDLLSLASGKILQWSICKSFRGGPGMEMRFRGRRATTDPHYPMIHFLELSEFIRACINNFTSTLNDTTGLSTAISWLVMNPQFREGGFISMMIALEHLLSKHNIDKPSPLPIDKAIFKADIRPALLDALESSFARLELESKLADDSGIALNMLKDRILSLNYMSLLKSIRRFTADIGAPVADLEKDLRDIVAIRNSLTHNGILPSEFDIDRVANAESALREFLYRIIMTIIGYDGPYSCFHDGNRVASFSDLHRARP